MYFDLIPCKIFPLFYFSWYQRMSVRKMSKTGLLWENLRKYTAHNWRIFITQKQWLNECIELIIIILCNFPDCLKLILILPWTEPKCLDGIFVPNQDRNKIWTGPGPRFCSGPSWTIPKIRSEPNVFV